MSAPFVAVATSQEIRSGDASEPLNAAARRVLDRFPDALLLLTYVGDGRVGIAPAHSFADAVEMLDEVVRVHSAVDVVCDPDVRAQIDAAAGLLHAEPAGSA